MKNNKQILTECYPCIFQQILSLSKIVKLDEEKRKLLFEKSMQYLIETHGTGVVVQHIIRKATDVLLNILEKSNDFDPYKEIKKYSNDIALKYYPMFKKKIKDSNSPLETAIKIAAAGNIIDFGAKNHVNLDINKELESVDNLVFGIYHYEKFYKLLSTAKTLLYICDNSGEIVLDKIFIEEIKKSFPSLNIICALRERPIINDATLNDAVYVGLDKLVKIISSGSIYPGTILEETSDEFKELFAKSDLIISKGQGNFETLLDENTDKIFFILRIKCEIMANLANTKTGNLVLINRRMEKGNSVKGLKR